MRVLLFSEYRDVDYSPRIIIPYMQYSYFPIS